MTFGTPISFRESAVPQLMAGKTESRGPAVVGPVAAAGHAPSSAEAGNSSISTKLTFTDSGIAFGSRTMTHGAPCSSLFPHVYPDVLDCTGSDGVGVEALAGAPEVSDASGGRAAGGGRLPGLTLPSHLPLFGHATPAFHGAIPHRVPLGIVPDSTSKHGDDLLDRSLDEVPCACGLCCPDVRCIGVLMEVRAPCDVVTRMVRKATAVILRPSC